MKPKSAAEKTCVELSAKLKPISEAQKRYAFKHCFDKKAIHAGKKQRGYTCLECGHTWEAEPGAKSIVCPHCHEKLKVGIGRRRSWVAERSTFAVFQTVEGWQVIRIYYVEKQTKPGEACRYSINEAVQNYMQAGVKTIVTIARNRKMSYYNDLYDYNKPMSIKHEGGYSNYMIWAAVEYPRRGLSKEVRRNGYTKALYGMSPCDTIYLLLTNPKYETLAKAGRLDIWKTLTASDIANHWPQIKMLIKYNYRPTDLKEWRDLVLMVKELGYDDRSPKYVTPNNLTKMHDFMVRKKAIADRAQKIEQHHEEDESYRKSYGKLLGVVLTDGDIEVKPLQCYAEFYDEGLMMHHCVETYWIGGGRGNGSLILSAKRDGKRVATIEPDRKTFKVLQCRGYCNKKPDEYDQIVKLITGNTKTFKNAKRKTA